MLIEKQRKKVKGFTLVELVIVIAIVIILSVVSVPIYRLYVEKAKYAEGYALMGTIITAQKAYYGEYGNFLWSSHSTGDQNYKTKDPVLGIDAGGNKYFNKFRAGTEENNIKQKFTGALLKPDELKEINGFRNIWFTYNISNGLYYWENN